MVIAWTVVGRFSAVPTGSLTITSKPVGAQLIVDGVVRGSTPATISVPEGMHSVEVRSSGPPQIMAVRIDKGGQMSRYFDLAPGTAPGVVRVDTKPADAKIMIDGTFRGRSPVVVNGLNPGRHVVRIEHGAQSREREVLLGPGATVAVSVPLDPLPRPTQGHGWVAIWTPVELQATEHGKPVGSSRAGPWQLLEGRHELELSNAMFGVSLKKTVDVVAGRTTSIDAGVPSGLVSNLVVTWRGDSGGRRFDRQDVYRQQADHRRPARHHGSASRTGRAPGVSHGHAGNHAVAEYGVEAVGRGFGPRPRSCRDPWSGIGGPGSERPWNPD